MHAPSAWEESEPQVPIRIASLGRRALAALIDAVPVDAGFLLGAHYFGTLRFDAHHFHASMSGAPSVVFALLVIGYFALLEGLFGATLGKLVMGIRVVRPDGTKPVGTGRALVRTLLRIVDAFPYVLPYLVGFVCALISGRDRRQRLGDLAVGTRVIRRG
jgi:uncharacterized RDD family membrane protein YckC